MKSIKKFVTVLGLVVITLLGSNSVQASGTGEHYSKIYKAWFIKGTLEGWADSHSFEVKTKDGQYFDFQSYNHWYMTHLREDREYTFVYYKINGMNVIMRVNK